MRIINIDEFDLICGRGINVDGVGIIRQPTLKEWREKGIAQYYHGISIMHTTKDDLANALNLPEFKETDIKPFDIFLLSEELAEVLTRALSPYIEGELRCNVEHGAILVIQSDGKGFGRIDRDNFSDVCDVILQINNMRPKDTADEESKFKNPKVSKAIWERLEAGRKKMEASKKNSPDNKALDIWNIIGAVCAHSSSYNLTNIWELTVWQLYDQFYRLNSEFYLDITTTRWCAWGDEPLDATPWFYQPNNDK